MNLIECFARYTTKCSVAEIKLKILSYMACIMFDANAPIVSLDNLDKFPLNNKCYDHGAIRLWVYNLHTTNETIPEKASTFYRKQPIKMKTLCIDFLNNFNCNDAYTLCHLFGDCYDVDVYINKKHVQEAAGSRLSLKLHKYKLFLKLSKKKFSIVVPKQIHRKPRRLSASFMMSSKYALRSYSEEPPTNIEIGLFVPSAMKHTYVVHGLAPGMYTIYPPDRTRRVTLDILEDHKLYLFNGENVLIDVYSPGQRENMYVELQDPKQTKQLTLVEARTEKQAAAKL